jgi:hypothetical protein
MTQEVRTEDIKVGETYNHRYISLTRKACRMLVKVVAIQYAYANKSVVSAVRVQRVDAPDISFAISPTTLETVE